MELANKRLNLRNIPSKGLFKIVFYFFRNGSELMAKKKCSVSCFKREAPKDETAEAMEADDSTIPKSSNSFKKKKFN